MSILLYYFSGTGNTLYLTEKIAGLLKSNYSKEVIIKDISSSMGEIIGEDIESVILNFPVYAYGPPKIVRRFIQNLKLRKKVRFSVILNYGLLFVNTYKITEKLLRKKKIKLSYCAGIRMPANYIVLYNPRATKEHVDKLIEKAESEDIPMIAEDVALNRNSSVKKGNILLRYIMYIIYGLFLVGANLLGKLFYADDKCNSCGKCVKVCPTGNIKLGKSKKPVWGFNCEQCVSCIHLCPVSSIQWGFITKSRLRYKNPNIDLENLYR